MSEEYLRDLYEWLTEAYEAALMLGQPDLAFNYAMQMRAM